MIKRSNRVVGFFSRSYVDKKEDTFKQQKNETQNNQNYGQTYEHIIDPKQAKENSYNSGEKYYDKEARDRLGDKSDIKERPQPVDKATDYPELKDSNKNMADADFSLNSENKGSVWESAKEYLKEAKTTIFGDKEGKEHANESKKDNPYVGTGYKHRDRQNWEFSDEKNKDPVDKKSDKDRKF